MRLIDAVADFAATTQRDELPPKIRRLSEDTLVDSVACALGGHAVDKGTLPVATAVAMGGPQQASILGLRSPKVSVVATSLANGELINALDWDAVLRPGHVAPHVLPALLAIAEARGVDECRLLTSVAVANEVACRVAGL